MFINFISNEKGIKTSVITKAVQMLMMTTYLSGNAAEQELDFQK